MADYWPSCFSAFLCRTDIPWVQGFAFSSFLFPWRSRDSEVQGKKKTSRELYQTVRTVYLTLGI